MPDVTVSANVDTMMRAANNAAIRSAIGLGQTDAPTFLSVGISANGGTPSSGLAWDSSSHLAFFHNSTIRMVVLSTGTTIGSDMAYSWGSAGIPTSASRDLILARDAAGILAQRNGTAAQAFRVYNTYTDASNYERALMGWSANNLIFGQELSGTGQRRDIYFQGWKDLYFRSGSGATTRWQISDSGGHLLAFADNTYDIGASGANRPKDINAAGAVRAQYLTLTTAPGVMLGYFQGQSAGVVTLTDPTGSNFGRLQLGGTTDAFPAIARDGAGIKFTGAATGLTSWIKVPAVAVSALPSASTAGAGARSFVNDALTPVFGSAVTGGGAVTVPVYSTGSAWNVG